MPSITPVIRPDTGVALAISYPGVTEVRVYRNQGGAWETYIRLGNTVHLDAAGEATAYDYEAELDTPVKWLARPWVPTGGADVESPVKIVPSFDQSWLKDPAFPTLNMRLPVMTGVGPAVRPANQGVFNVVDRADPIVISTVRSTEQGTLVLHTLTLQQRASLLTLLSSGRVLLFQTPNGYGFADMYVAIGEVQEERVSTLGFVQARRWTMAYTVVTMPPGVAAAPAFQTWDVVNATFASWDAIKAQGKSWNQLLEGG